MHGKLYSSVESSYPIPTIIYNCEVCSFRTNRSNLPAYSWGIYFNNDDLCQGIARRLPIKLGASSHDSMYYTIIFFQTS